MDVGKDLVFERIGGYYPYGGGVRAGGLPAQGLPADHAKNTSVSPPEIREPTLMNLHAQDLSSEAVTGKLLSSTKQNFTLSHELWR